MDLSWKMVQVPDIRLKMSNNSFNQGDTLISEGWVNSMWGPGGNKLKNTADKSKVFVKIPLMTYTYCTYEILIKEINFK